MKRNSYISCIALAAALFLFLGISILIRTFAPLAVLPKLTVPNMVLLSLIAQLIAHYMPSGKNASYLAVLLFSGLTFGLLSFAASYTYGLEALKLALVGGVLFTVTSFLFDQILERLSSGPAAKAAPVLSALGLFLAVQCFSGLF